MCGNVGAHLGLFYLLALPELGLVSSLSALPKSRLSQSIALVGPTTHLPAFAVDHCVYKQEGSLARTFYQ